MNVNTNLVTWSPTYSVGIKEIDEQHKGLLDLVNDMYNHVVGDEDTERAYFKNVIHQAIDYVKVHFSTEEKILKSVKFDGFAEHKRAHDSFVLKVVDNVRDYQDGKKGTLSSFTHFLKDWILTHIAIMDKQYFEYFKKTAAHKEDGTLNIASEDIMGTSKNLG